MRREPIGELCRGRWESILTALGVDAKYLQNKHGPCVMCGGKDRWRWDNKDGKGTWFCSHCGAGDGVSLLTKIHGWSFVQTAREIERVLGTSRPDAGKPEFTDAEKREVLRRTWRESRPVEKGDPVWTYLHRRTGIEIIPDCIRFHPMLRYDASCQWPAMLAVVTMPDGKATTMHRTWLTESGEKAPVEQPKKTMPGMIKTGAIRLSPVSETLGIAEGIETALAASIRFQVPTWAAISAGGMRDWEPPQGVKQVMIFSDNDANYTGQSAAFSLAHRLSMRGISADVRVPERIGTDWADAQ